MLGLGFSKGHMCEIFMEFFFSIFKLLILDEF